MLLHNFIPHIHESELNTSEHIKIHKAEPSSSTELLSLLFHEFTEEGDMEDMLVKSNTSISFAASFIALPTINKQLTVTFFEEKETRQYFLPFDELRLSTGFSTAWSVRPPPFA